MKIKVRTELLKEMTSKATKGASNNQLIPITGLMGIELKDNKLTLTTTDATNVMQVHENNVEGADFYIVIQEDLFNSLISRTTSEFTELTLKEGQLEITGNGVYNLEIPLDEEGEPIIINPPKFNTEVEKKYVDLKTIETILTANKAALAETLEIPCLTGYYFYPNGVMTTDTFKVCGTELKVFDKEVLLSRELVDYLQVMKEDKIAIQEDGDKILFTTDKVTVFGYELDEVAEFPADSIQAFLDSEFSSKCIIPKKQLTEVIQRLSLFVTTYDRNGLYLTFTNKGVNVSSKKSSGEELIEYKEIDNFVPFTCAVDIELLSTQITAQQGTDIELWYGHPKAVKMTQGKITQIIALLEDEREEE